MLQLPENLFSNLTCNPCEIDHAPSASVRISPTLGTVAEVEPAISWSGRRSGREGSVGVGHDSKLVSERLRRLIAIAEKRKLDAARPHISDLQRHALGEGAFDVQIPLFNVGGAIVEQSRAGPSCGVRQPWHRLEWGNRPKGAGWASPWPPGNRSG